MRYLVGVLVTAAVVGFGWVFSLPNKAECVASGRVVDPTERHCEAAGGFQQLQEHATFHATHVVLGVLLLLAIGFGIRWFVRRRSMSPRPAA